LTLALSASATDKRILLTYYHIKGTLRMQIQESISTYATTATTYIIAIVSMFFAGFISYYSHIAAVLGFLLLIARLVQEVPKAWNVLFKKEKKDDN